jgi:hypothetical protein
MSAVWARLGSPRALWQNLEDTMAENANNFYAGPTMRGVDYSPTWPGWSANQGTQTGDSDFANDAFQSLWSGQYTPAPNNDPSRPVDNSPNYRHDLQTIKNLGFNLVRLYNWGMARGTSSSSDIGLDHLNFLNSAQNLGLQVVVPISDYFVGDDQYSWNRKAPDLNYSFSSAPDAIQKDFTQFVNSITDPGTGKIHQAVHSISIGNEGDLGEGIKETNTTASNFLARTIWWIVNLHKQINGSGSGPNGQRAVNGASPVIMLSATVSDGDEGGSTPGWFNCLIKGVTTGQATPNGCNLGPTFEARVTGLADADGAYADYYYNSLNISKVAAANNSNNLEENLQWYDSGRTDGWPWGPMKVPLMFMEVFAPNRGTPPPSYDQATAAVNQIKSIESYLKSKNAGTKSSTTWLMGYNYFEFNDEPVPNKKVGLFGYGTGSPPQAQTGITSLFYGSFGNVSFPVYPLSANPGPAGANTTLPDAISACLPPHGK